MKNVKFKKELQSIEVESFEDLVDQYNHIGFERKQYVDYGARSQLPKPKELGLAKAPC